MSSEKPLALLDIPNIVFQSTYVSVPKILTWVSVGTKTENNETSDLKIFSEFKLTVYKWKTK